MRYEVVTLEYKSYSVVSVNVPISVGVGFRADSGYRKIAGGVVVKTAYDIKKRSLSATRRTEYRDELSLPERKGESLKRLNRLG